MLEIQKMISNYNYSSRQGSSIKYIVLHFTGNSSDKAISNANYFNECDRSASAHYFCDNDSIWQVVEDYNSAWAVGDGRGDYGITNRNSISIEMCCSGNSEVSETTENNTIELVKYLMSKYSIDIQHIVRHFDASYKACPNWEDNNWSRWYKFKDKITNGYSTTGWQKNDKGYWYKNEDSSYPKECWKEIKNTWYYFDSEGYMRTSWLDTDGHWFYLKDWGGMARNEWLNIGGESYYFADGGALYMNCYTPDGYWVSADGSWDNSIPRKLN